MEKINKVITAMEQCHQDVKYRDCDRCDYADDGSKCERCLMKDALAWLKEQNRLIEELSSNIPCCDNCDGKTTLGERTDKCVYEIEGFDSVLYCAKRGIENCFGYRKKIEELEAKLKESEPVVHAHWEELGVADYKCSRCGFRFTSGDPITMFPYCRCGAHMDEEVADGLHCSE